MMEPEFMADVITRLIEGDMLGDNEWRPAATLDFLCQSLAIAIEEDDLPEERREAFAHVLSDVVTMMTYLDIQDPVSTEEEIEEDVHKWRQILDRVDRPDDEEDES